MKAMPKKNPFAGYKESKRETKKDERKESKGLKAYEKKMGLEKKTRK